MRMDQHKPSRCPRTSFIYDVNNNHAGWLSVNVWTICQLEKLENGLIVCMWGTNLSASEDQRHHPNYIK